jgi:predicted RNA-binding protein with PIN domain
LFDERNGAGEDRVADQLQRDPYHRKVAVHFGHHWPLRGKEAALARHRWILIDGYNLLHASGVFGSGGRTPLESSREALLDWLGDILSEGERQRTTIVFDARQAPPGLSRSAEKHGLTVRFAPRGSEADDLLEQLIGQHPHPRALTVVSSDHRLQRAARRRRAAAIDSDRWVKDIRRRPVERESEPDQHVQLEPEELEDFLDEFRDG